MKTNLLLLIILIAVTLISCKQGEKNVTDVKDQVGTRVEESPISRKEKQNVPRPTNSNTSITKGLAPVNDATIEYFDQGTGDVIILLSGRGLDVGYLSPLANSLSEAGFRTIRVNRREAGRSKGNLADITYHTYAKDVRGVMDHLGIAKATILGHALGNRIARIFDADFPEATTSIILMPAAGKIGSSQEEQEATSKMFMPDATQDEIMNGMQYMVGDPADREWVWEIIKGSCLKDPAALKAEVSATAPLDEWWAPNTSTPYLVLHGTKDKSAPLENAYLLQKDLGERMTLVTLEGLGHLAPVEDPEQVTTSILKYFEK